MISNATSSLVKSHSKSIISNASNATLGDYHYDQLQLSQFTETDKKDTTIDLAKRLGLVTVDRRFPVNNWRRVFYY